MLQLCPRRASLQGAPVPFLPVCWYAPAILLLPVCLQSLTHPLHPPDSLRLLHGPSTVPGAKEIFFLLF